MDKPNLNLTGDNTQIQGDMLDKIIINFNNSLNTAEDSEMIEINKLIENLDYENAKKLLQNKITREPNNTEAIDTLAEVLLNMDESDSVIKVEFI
jgi:thioredoxin-like negative regulator of GroEL